MDTAQIELLWQGARVEMILHGPEGKPFTVDQPVLQQMERAIDSIEKEATSKGTRLLVLKSASPKYFCVGANINVLKTLSADTVSPWVLDGHRIFNRLEDLDLPSVALVTGYAMGGGLELAMCCDFIYAGENAKFGQSEARLGFVPGWGGTRRLVDRVGMPAAKKLFFRGDILDAAGAETLGLVDFVGDETSLCEELASLESAISENSATAIASFKAILHRARESARSTNAQEEALYSVTCLKDADTLQRVDAFLNRKK